MREMLFVSEEKNGGFYPIKMVRGKKKKNIWGGGGPGGKRMKGPWVVFVLHGR